MDAGACYPTDQDKIDFCVMSFAASPAAKVWIMDSIIDPANRNFDAITSYNSAKQGDGQSAEDFAAYLDTLELELYINDEKQRRDNLYAKLREDVQRDLLQRDEVLATRQGLLSLATRIENRHRLADRRAGRRMDGHAKAVRREPTPRREPWTGREARRGPETPGREARTEGPATSPNRTTTGSRPDRRGNGCHGCGSEEHRLAQCPKAGPGDNLHRPKSPGRHGGGLGATTASHTSHGHGGGRDPEDREGPDRQRR
ncbi:hypothetical protein V493_01207 [Pseudogymnoascus sp. VKM F-4281 (FW-2241)]|nr:hypothetical protein V493_01207 [Pseudogymnoascus sp. VKM F-4281 (FW-2241)]